MMFVKKQLILKLQMLVGDATKLETLTNLFNDVEVVISAIGVKNSMGQSKALIHLKLNSIHGSGSPRKYEPRFFSIEIEDSVPIHFPQFLLK